MIHTYQSWHFSTLWDCILAHFGIAVSYFLDHILVRLGCGLQFLGIAIFGIVACIIVPLSRPIHYKHCCSNYSDFLSCYRVLVTRLLSQGYKGNCLSNTCKKSYGRHRHPVGQCKKKLSAKFLLILFMDLPMVELIK